MDRILASRGAALMLKGDPDDPSQHSLSFLAEGVGYPGTLVALEVPIASVHDYAAMIATINGRANDRTPGRVTYQWIRFDDAPAGSQAILVKVASENTASAQRYAEQELLPRLFKKQPLVLDFRSFEIVTQSYVHALLYEAVRVAWAFKTPIFICNAKPAVRSTIAVSMSSWNEM